MKRLAPYMVWRDDRGQLTGITQGAWHEANIIDSTAGAKRGGHYHQDTLELFYMVAGQARVEAVHMDSGARREILVSAGDILLVEPREWHLFTCLEDSRWINMLSKPMDPDNPDLIRPDRLPPPPDDRRSDLE